MTDLSDIETELDAMRVGIEALMNAQCFLERRTPGDRAAIVRLREMMRGLTGRIDGVLANLPLRRVDQTTQLMLRAMVGNLDHAIEVGATARQIVSVATQISLTALPRDPVEWS
jgi:hypothetical protein